MGSTHTQIRQEISIRGERKSNNSVNVNNEVKLLPFTDDVGPSPFKVKQSDRFHSRLPNEHDCYSMESDKRCVAFIVNNAQFQTHEPRNGAHIDKNYLITMFKEMGFSIFYYEDITATVSTFFY